MPVYPTEEITDFHMLKLKRLGDFCRETLGDYAAATKE